MDGFVFFRSYYEAINKLPDDQKLNVYQALASYAFDGIEEPEDKITQIMLIMARRHLKTFDYGDRPFCDDWSGTTAADVHGERTSAAYKRFREAVLERDGYTCQNCGTTSGVMNVHHIKPFAKFPELRMEVSNGITLCEKCHRKAHKNEKR